MQVLTSLEVPQSSKYVGMPIKRREDYRFLIGKGHYVGDFRLPNMKYAAFARSPYAHARIKKVDLNRALEVPGVVLALSGNEILKMNVKPLEVRLTEGSLRHWAGYYPLAVDKVRYVGECVALVVANSYYTARDAVEQIEVEYEPLPAIIDAERAINDCSSLVHEEWGDNLFATTKYKTAKLDETFRNAKNVIRQTFVIDRISGNPIETKYGLADYDKGSKRLSYYVSAQRPSIMRTAISESLSKPENSVRVIVPDVGGAFGSKGPVRPEDISVCLASLMCGHPVLWTEDRHEHMCASSHSRECKVSVEVAFQTDGKIDAVRCKIISDMGAYSLYPTSASIEAAGMASLFVGPYDIQQIGYESYIVTTNKSPKSPIRGSASTNATFVINRVMSMVATELRMETSDVIQRNLIKSGQMPFKSPTGLTYDSGDYVSSFERARDELRKFRSEMDKSKDHRLIGFGIASYVKTSGSSTKKTHRTGARTNATGMESAAIKISPTGKATLFTNLCSHGQGHETAFAQIVADELGIELDDVSVIEGDTDKAPYGVGTFGSRSLVIGGGAIIGACRQLREKILAIASEVLKAPARDLSMESGRIIYRNRPDSTLRLADVARIAYIETTDLPEGMQPGLETIFFYDTPFDAAVSFGTHAAVVAVDPETGATEILKYIAVEDCGRVVNPLILEGQVHGGITLGIAQTLLEKLVYSEDGDLLTTSFMDYLLPSALEVPPILSLRSETPSFSPRGFKGGGEESTVAAPAAIIDAISDAIGAQIELGSVTPEIVWRRIHPA